MKIAIKFLWAALAALSIFCTVASCTSSEEKKPVDTTNQQLTTPVITPAESTTPKVTIKPPVSFELITRVLTNN